MGSRQHGFEDLWHQTQSGVAVGQQNSARLCGWIAYQKRSGSVQPAQLEEGFSIDLDPPTEPPCDVIIQLYRIKVQMLSRRPSDMKHRLQPLTKCAFTQALSFERGQENFFVNGIVCRKISNPQRQSFIHRPVADRYERHTRDFYSRMRRRMSESNGSDLIVVSWWRLTVRSTLRLRSWPVTRQEPLSTWQWR